MIRSVGRAARVAGFALVVLVAGAARAQEPPEGTPAGNPADPEAPTVGASLDKSDAAVGDRLLLTVQAVARGATLVTLPPKLDLGRFEVLDRKEDPEGGGGRDIGNGRRAFRFVLGVATYEPGELELPSIPLTWTDSKGEPHTIATAPLQVTVRSVLPTDEAQIDVQAPRPPRAAFIEDRRVLLAVRWGAIGLGALFLLLLIRSFVRRALKARRAEAALVPEVPRRPADEVAMEKLQALRRAGGFARDGYRPFAFAVAEIVREYLGARWGFESLELTTTELVDALTARAPHLVNPGGELLRFLSETDLIKFANAGCTDERAEALLKTAEVLVLTTSRHAPAVDEKSRDEAAPPAAAASGGGA